MERARVFRYIRIAVTALSLTACVLLIALWVRSYRYRELAMARHPNWGTTSAISIQGKVTWQIHSYKSPRSFSPSWEVSSSLHEHSGTFGMKFTVPEGEEARGFTLVKRPDLLGIVLPFWFLVLCSACLAAIPWIPWSKRFSLRTLLIATTLVAVVFGLIGIR